MTPPKIPKLKLRAYHKKFGATGEIFRIDFDEKEVVMTNVGGAPCERMVANFDEVDFIFNF